MKRSDLLALQAELEADFNELAAVVREIRRTAEPLPAEPSLKDKAALGAFVHSFYNGVENLLKRLAQQVDQSLPSGEGWHRALLQRMTTEIPSVRPPVLQRQTAEILEPYLGFRHFFRHAYTFEIEWQKLKPLVDGVEEAFKKLRRDLDDFFTTQLRRAGGS